MKIFLVRHGESVGNTKRGFISGRSDTQGLTIKGKSQVARAAFTLDGLPIKTVITSPVVRAKESAEILQRILCAPVVVDVSLSELDHGVIEGHYWWEMRDRFPPNWRKNLREDYKTRYEGGESFKELAKRVYDGYQKILKNYSGDILLVTHQAILATLIYCHTKGNPDDDALSYMEFVHSTFTSNAAIVELDVATKKHTLRKLSLPPLEANTDAVKIYVKGVVETSSADLNAERLTTFSRNHVFLVKNSRSLLFKLLSDEGTLGGERLASMYTFLEKNNSIPAPHLIHFDPSGVFFKDAVFILDYLMGDSIVTCLANHPERMNKLHHELYETVIAIHSLPVSAVESFWSPHDWGKAARPVWEDYIGSQIDTIVTRLPEFKLKEKTCAKIVSSLTSLKNYLSSASRWVPLHGDFAPQNLIVEHKNEVCRLIRIIDFERARIGDGLWDLVFYFGWLERANEKAAANWKTICFNNLRGNEKKHFEEYRMLFHAWTVLDMLDYKGNEKRKEVAMVSKKLLEK